jgi:hypothetical protein
MDPTISTIISSIFLVVGGIAVFIMLNVQGGNAKNLKLSITWHRILGWIFVTLFLLMFVVMISRLENFWEESPPRIAIHIALATSLLFLIALKVMIPRFYPKLGRNLFQFGIIVFIAAFTLVAITAGYYALRTIEGTPYISHADLPPNMVDLNLGQELFITECSICHSLDRIMTPRSVSSWEKVINEMVRMAEPRISPAEAAQILSYLSQTHTPRTINVGADASPAERYCLGCHSIDDIYNNNLTTTGWRVVVERMSGYAPDIIPADQIDSIVNYLFQTQDAQGLSSQPENPTPDTQPNN